MSMLKHGTTLEAFTPSTIFIIVQGHSSNALHRGEAAAEGIITFWPKDVGKEFWQDAPEHKVGICDGRIASLAIAHGAWMGSS